MRQFRILTFVLVIAMLVAGCGGSKATPTAATSGSTSTTSAGSTATTRATGTAAVASPSGTSSAVSQSGTAATSTSGSTVASPAPSPSSTASTAATSGPSNFEYGFNVFAREDANGQPFNQQVISAVKGAGFGWVRVPLLWANFEPAPGAWNPLPVDRLVNQFGGAGVKLLLTVSDAPQWAINKNGQSYLSNYGDFQQLMQFLASRYKGKVQAWEIWNEENLASNMNGIVRVDDYCRLLQAGYLGVKAGDPNALVVFGGLTPTGVNNPKVAIDDVTYLNQFYTHQNGYYTKFFDVLGVHTNATDHPPSQLYPSDPGTGGWSNSGSFYFRRAEQLRQVMQNHGDARPVWITEFGWTTANQAPGYGYGANVSPQQQAQYLVGAFDWAHTHWPWVTGMFVWNLNYSVITQPSDEKYPWSVLNSDWSPRPAYTALKAMPKS